MQNLICVIPLLSVIIVVILYAIDSKKDKKLVQYLDRIKTAQQEHTINLSNLKILIDNCNSSIALLNDNQKILKDLQEANFSAIAKLTERHIHLQEVVSRLKYIDRVRKP